MMRYIQGNPIIMCGFILWIWFPIAILGFNVDTKNMNVITGPKGTLFGFAASFLPDNGNGTRLRLLVGAPSASTAEGGQESGVLHVCENVLNKAETCATQRRFDDDIPMYNGTVNEEFGSAIAMTNSGKFMVCSPNWRDTEMRNLHFQPGRCTFSDLNGTIKEQFWPFYKNTTIGKQRYYIISLDGKTQYYEGLANFGFSADSDRVCYSDHNHTIKITRLILTGEDINENLTVKNHMSFIFVFGAPGVLTSEGTVTIMNMNTKSESRINSTIANKLTSTAYGYLGYSVKIGRFCNGSDICIAAGAPNLNRVGMVFLYKWKDEKSLELFDKCNGEQAWSYFGYALCAVDTNSDNYDELLVGAPHYTDLDDKLHGHDQGRVFIYSRSERTPKFEKVGVLEGSREKFARFGSAIQNIGDVNLDKFNDVVIGAPGEDNGAGCIYIYFGGSAGLIQVPSQRITAKQVSIGLKSPVTGFGFAFSDHVIPSDAKYPIFVATSVVSDAIVVFNSRPIVDVEANLTAEPNPVDTEKLCTEAGVAGVCFKINMCMKYRLRGGGNTELTFQISLDMDVQVRSNLKRALFRLNNGSLVESVPEVNKKIKANANDDCTQYLAVLRDNQVNQDRFTPVQIIAKYKLVEDLNMKVNPILDAMKPSNVSLAVTFLNKCGTDNICTVDLSVAGSLIYKPTGNWQSIVVNGTKELQVNVGVKNSKETSYWTVIKLEIDSPLSYSRSTSDAGLQANCQQERPVLDATNAVANNAPVGLDKTMVVCNFYKPVDQGASFSLFAVFDTEQIELTKRKVKITVEAMPKNKNNPEEFADDNTFSMETNIDIIAVISIDGTSSPTEDTVFEAKKISVSDTSSSRETFRKTGSEVKPFNVTHKILVQNKGPSFLPNTNVIVYVPMFLLDRTELIHYADVKITANGKVSDCVKTKTDLLQQATTSTSQTFTTSPTYAGSSDKSQPTDAAGITPDTSSEQTTEFTFESINRRRKRASDDKKEVKNTIYTLDCDTDKDICQVFVCQTNTVIQPGSHAEINVSLVIDKANIPMPENSNAFYYTVETIVNEPTHPLFQKWKEQPTVKSGGKVNIWIIIGCVIAGLVLITIIVLIFWKLGFFKRDKHKQVEQWKRESKRRSRKGYSKAPTEDAPGSAPADVDSKPDADL